MKELKKRLLDDFGPYSHANLFDIFDQLGTDVYPLRGGDNDLVVWHDQIKNAHKVDIPESLSGYLEYLQKEGLLRVGTCFENARHVLSASGQLGTMKIRYYTGWMIIVVDDEGFLSWSCIPYAWNSFDGNFIDVTLHSREAPYYKSSYDEGFLKRVSAGIPHRNRIFIGHQALPDEAIAFARHWMYSVARPRGLFTFDPSTAEASDGEAVPEKSDDQLQDRGADDVPDVQNEQKPGEEDG